MSDDISVLLKYFEWFAYLKYLFRFMTVNNACRICRQKKILCSKTEPRCHYCVRKGLLCEYVLDTSTHKFSSFVSKLEQDVAELRQEHQNSNNIEVESVTERPLSVLEPEQDEEGMDLAIEKAIEKVSQVSLSAVTAGSIKSSLQLSTEENSQSHLIFPSILFYSVIKPQNEYEGIELPPEKVTRGVCLKYLRTLNSSSPIFDPQSLNQILHVVYQSNLPRQSLQLLFCKIALYLVIILTCSYSSDTSIHAVILFYNAAYLEINKYYNHPLWTFSPLRELQLLNLLYQCYQFKPFVDQISQEQYISNSNYIEDLILRICLDIGLHQNAKTETELNMLGHGCSIDASIAFHFNYPLRMNTKVLKNTIFNELKHRQPFKVYRLFNEFSWTELMDDNNARKHQELVNLNADAQKIEKEIRLIPQSRRNNNSYETVLHIDLLILLVRISIKLNDQDSLALYIQKLRELMIGFKGQVPQAVSCSLKRLPL